MGFRASDALIALGQMAPMVGKSVDDYFQQQRQAMLEDAARKRQAALDEQDRARQDKRDALAERVANVQIAGNEQRNAEDKSEFERKKAGLDALGKLKADFQSYHESNMRPDSTPLPLQSKAQIANTQLAGYGDIPAVSAFQKPYQDEEKSNRDTENARKLQEQQDAAAMERSKLSEQGANYRAGLANDQKTQAAEERARLAEEKLRIAENKATPDDKVNKANEVLQVINDMKAKGSGMGSAVGMWGAVNRLGVLDKPIPGTKAASFNSKMETLRSLLTLDNLGKLKGALSDKDMEVLRSAATMLNRDLSEEDFRKELGRIESKMNSIVTSGGVVGQGGGGNSDKMALAKQALDDPDATEQEKAQARKILGL